MNIYKKAGTNLFSYTMLYSVLILGALSIIYLTTKFELIGGIISIGVIPALYYVFIVLDKPYWGLVSIFIANYFIMGAVRYFPKLQGGIVMDLLIYLTLAGLIFQTCFRGFNWSGAKNKLTFVSFIWLLYCCFEIFNPEGPPLKAWATSIRGIALYFFIIVVLSSVLYREYKDLKRIIYIWSVLTLLAVLKAYIQKNYGFDLAEKRWLYIDGGKTTHIIFSGIRYFSFYTDAANFGAGMGFAMVTFSIAAFYIKSKWIRAYFLFVAFAAGYGMMISGTRGAMAVPFFGYTLFILLSKKFKAIVIGTIFVAGAFVFFNFTTIGEGNREIRRMRSAFNSEDASYLVRLENQRKMKQYMFDKYVGVGIGMGGGKAKQHAPNAYMSQIPTDSWFVMIWVETGIIGLILHISILSFIIIYGAYIVMFQIKNKELKGILAAILSGTAGIIVCSYGNEILGQFPTAYIVYTGFTFIFVGKHYDQEIELKRLQQKSNP